MELSIISPLNDILIYLIKVLHQKIFHENENSSKNLAQYPSHKMISASSNGQMQMNSMFAQQYEAASSTS